MPGCRCKHPRPPNTHSSSSQVPAGAHSTPPRPTQSRPSRLARVQQQSTVVPACAPIPTPQPLQPSTHTHRHTPPPSRLAWVRQQLQRGARQPLQHARVVVAQGGEGPANGGHSLQQQRSAAQHSRGQAKSTWVPFTALLRLPASALLGPPTKHTHIPRPWRCLEHAHGCCRLLHRRTGSKAPAAALPLLQHGPGCGNWPA